MAKSKKKAKKKKKNNVSVKMGIMHSSRYYHDGGSSKSIGKLKVDTEEIRRRKERLERFNKKVGDSCGTQQKKRPSLKRKRTADGDISPIVGRSKTVEKEYLRLTTLPDPSSVRPLQILKRALRMVKSRWREDEDYTYACEQLKSIRQDMTVQHMNGRFCVDVYETHARIALEEGDLNEFHQCQTRLLRSLYSRSDVANNCLVDEGNVSEFCAYQILYFAAKNIVSDLESFLRELSPAILGGNEVKTAISIVRSVSDGNYDGFFRFYSNEAVRSTMMPFLMDFSSLRVRKDAIDRMLKAYSPYGIELSFVLKALDFRSKKKFCRFLRKHFPSATVRADEARGEVLVLAKPRR